MPKLDIDDHMITELIHRAAPLVTQATGWNLGLPSLRTHVLPKDQGYEEIVESKLRLLGLQVNSERDIIDRTIEYLVENNVLAAYEPLSNELMVIRENVDDSNREGLLLVLAHELTHRGQHVNHPALFERINHNLVRILKGLETGESDIWKMRVCYEEVRPIMTLIESHASYIQAALSHQYFPQARIERHFTLPVLIFRVLGYGKVSQYTESLPQVAEAMKRGKIDYLFRGFGSV